MPIDAIPVISKRSDQPAFPIRGNDVIIILKIAIRFIAPFIDESQIIPVLNDLTVLPVISPISCQVRLVFA
ncbi:MAG TPA: hypothetical protein VMV89_09635 [Candidatus Paceibacterota bacterium]|nr:hypothetical protein [Candidatus Paceibacterota bacterium]